MIAFDEKERAALQIANMPVEIDAFFPADREESFKMHDKIQKEVLGPGLSENGDINEYGDALLCALSKIAHRERELYGPLVLS